MALTAFGKFQTSKYTPGVTLGGHWVLVFLFSGYLIQRGKLYLECNLYTHNDTKLVHKSNFPPYNGGNCISNVICTLYYTALRYKIP